MRPHSATGLIDRIEKLGLVGRVAGSGDRRRVAVTLTPRGEALLESLSTAHLSELRRIRPLFTALFSTLGQSE